MKLTVLQNLVKRAGGNSALMLVLGFAIGALTNIYPVPSAIIFFILLVIIVIPIIIDVIKERQLSNLSLWEEALRQPDPHAAAFVSRTNEHFLVIGQAIEILPHPKLNTRANIDELGWSPSSVQLNDLQKNFNANIILDRSGGYKEFDPPNGIKFSLSNTSFITKDSPNLSLDLTRTNYFTLKSVLPTIRQNPDLRVEFGSLNPASNSIPHSLCLHYITRFSGGEVLCMRRDPRAAYHGNLWSFSGEEQLSEEDFRFQFPTFSFFQRTICEEVFSLREDNPLEDKWKLVNPHIKNMSLGSIFVEEEIFNFAMFGVYQLKDSIAKFISFHNNLIDEGTGSRDREGDFFVVSQDLLKDLLFKGQCTVKALFTNDEQLIRAENLHPTSRYRIFRLLRAVNRKPLQPEVI
ncbi:MAG: hypothetical protein OEZ20_08905 [candidate division WOR-3 bacterium]|nr:hypothetical protein [candidate division WOR-3 bacterium]